MSGLAVRQGVRQTLLVACESAALHDLAQHYKSPATDRPTGVFSVNTEDELIEFLSFIEPDGLILDLGLSDDGPALLTRVRRSTACPVLAIAATDGPFTDLQWPTTAFELNDHITRIMNQRLSQFEEVKQIGSVTVDMRRHQVLRDNVQVHFAPIETQLLTYLLLHPDRLVTYEELACHVWPEGESSPREASRTLAAHMCRLRKKVEPHPTEEHDITTVYGLGYQLSTEHN